MVGWSNVTVNLLGKDLTGITDISYSDTLDWENQYGAGLYPVGQGAGNYEAEASVTMLQEERIQLLQSLPAGTRIQEVAPFDMIVSYEYNNQVYKDIVRNCRFRTNGMEVAQADKTIAFEFELICTHIDYNV